MNKGDGFFLNHLLMRRRLLLMMMSSFWWVCLLAQQNQGEAFPSAKTRFGLKEKQVGTSMMYIDYAMNADSIGQEQTYIDLQRLEIGEDCAKYSSLFLKRSVAGTRLVNGGQGIARGGKGGKRGDFWNDIQYTDLYFKDGLVTEYASMPMWNENNNSEFTEPCPSQQWELHDETQTILEHRCQKATCHWRGRDYVAWFAPDIPVKRGPWRFNGLPGLILKLYDTNHFYTFEAVSLKKTHEPIMLYDFKYSKSTRPRVRKLQRALQVNFWKAVTGESKFPDKPFEQLEKE